MVYDIRSDQDSVALLQELTDKVKFGFRQAFHHCCCINEV